MELLSILFGIIFWPVAIFVWIVYIRRQKPPKWLQIVGTLIVLGMPLVAAVSMGKYMFLDEPLVTAIMNGNTVEAKSLLANGADPNADFEGFPALERAASQGEVEIVRLLLAHGAHTSIRNNHNGNTALQSAQKNGHVEVASLLRQAEATNNRR